MIAPGPSPVPARRRAGNSYPPSTPPGSSAQVANVVQRVGRTNGRVEPPAQRKAPDVAQDKPHPPSRKSQEITLPAPEVHARGPAVNHYETGRWKDSLRPASALPRCSAARTC